MAKISYRENANELENLYRKNLSPADRFNFSTIRVKKTLFTKKYLSKITQKSLMPEISLAWSNLSNYDKSMWLTSYAEYFKNGFRAFVKSYIQRKKAGLSGIPDYNNFFLGKVGQVHIESPANRCHIKQDHPNNYYVMTKVAGTKSQFNPVVIYEFATFPINFRLSYKSNLSALSSNFHARVYIRIYTDYQGKRLMTDFIQLLDLSTENISSYGSANFGSGNYGLLEFGGWERLNFNIDKPLGTFKGYEFHIDLYDVIGDVYFDNLYIYHSGRNWGRDPHFENMRTTYTRKYYQIASHYDIIDLPNGANFNSIYYD